MRKKTYRGIFKLSLAICFIICGCGGSGKNYPPVSIEKNAAFPDENKPDPLKLVVEIRDNGVLSLNKIETGTIADPGVLSEKIAAIFDDREKNKITEREVFIRRGGAVKNEDLESVIELLVNVQASPIRILEEN